MEEQKLTIIGALAIFALIMYILVRTPPADKSDRTGWEGGAGDRILPLPPSTTAAQCSSPFGSINGEANAVPAYSNCNDDYTGSEFYSVPLQSVMRSKKSSAMGEHSCSWQGCPVNVTTGLEWQCVEYARRHLFIRSQAVFGSVIGAADIWLIENITQFKLKDEISANCTCETVQVSWETIPNGHSNDIWIRPGDLVIYPRGAVGPFGHVCVVDGVEKLSNDTNGVARVRVAEQNWNNAPWPVSSGPDAYARYLYLKPRADGSLVLQDALSDGLYPIYGVKRF
jgi:hypothetical protein